jgi:hypothetical protein
VIYDKALLIIFFMGDKEKEKNNKDEITLSKD